MRTALSMIYRDQVSPINFIMPLLQWKESIGREANAGKRDCWESESGSWNLTVLRSVAACPCLNALLLFSPLHCLGCDLELSRCVRAWLWTAPHPKFPHSLVLPLAQAVPTAVCRLIYAQDTVACLDKALPGSSSPRSAWDLHICFMTEYRPLSIKLGLSTWHHLCKGCAGYGPQCYWESSLTSQNL